MSNLFRPTYTKIEPKTGERVLRVAKKWYGKYRDADGIERRVPLCKDKESATAMLTDLVKRVERIQAGIVERCDEFLQMGIKEQLADYRSSLEAKARAEKHVDDTLRTIQRIMDHCRLRILADLQGAGDALEKFLADRLKSGRSHLTVNADLVAVRSFCRWLLVRQRIRTDPTANLTCLSVEQDRRRERRSLTEEESRRLL